MARLMLLGVLMLTLACVAHSAEVHALDAEDATPNANDASLASAGRAEGSKILNMPGTPYGNKGYKEAYQWETAVDVWSPAVFNAEYYAAKNSIQGKSDAELKSMWKQQALAADQKAPDCKQAVASFSLNLYFANNPVLKESTGGSCLKLLEHYLSEGMYDALSGATSISILSSQKSEFGVAKTEENTDTVGKDHITPSQEYTLSMWLKLTGSLAVDANILHYGDSDGQRSPAIYAKAGTTNLKFSISQDNLPNFECHLDLPGTGTPEAKEQGPCVDSRCCVDNECTKWRTAESGAGCGAGAYCDPTTGQIKKKADGELLKAGDALCNTDEKSTSVIKETCKPKVEAAAKADEEATGILKIGQFYGLSLVTNSNGADVYLNGQKQQLYMQVPDPEDEDKMVQQAGCHNADGNTVVPKENTHLYLSDPWSDAARAEIQGLTYYPDYKMTPAEIAAQLAIEQKRIN